MNATPDLKKTIELTARLAELVDAFASAQAERCLLTFNAEATDEQAAAADAQTAHFAMQIAQDIYNQTSEALPDECSHCHRELDIAPDGAPMWCQSCHDD